MAGGAREVDGGVEREEEQESGGRRGVGGDEFEPGEGEEPGGGGPQTEPYGKGPARGGVAAQCAAAEEVDGAQRVEQPPDGTEEERCGHQPDPEEYVYGPGARVAVRVVRAEEEVERDVQGGGEAERAQRDTGGAGVGEALEGGRERAARPVAAEPGGGPEQAEREEGDEERGECTGEGVEGGKREVVLGADAVGEDAHRTTSWVRSRSDSWVSTSKSPLRSAVNVRVTVLPAGSRASLS